MSAMEIDPVIPLLEFRVFFQIDKRIGDLNQKGFQIRTSMGNASGFYFAVALVIAQAASSQETRCFDDGNTDIFGSISERMVMAVIGFLFNPGRV